MSERARCFCVVLALMAAGSPLPCAAAEPPQPAAETETCHVLDLTRRSIAEAEAVRAGIDAYAAQIRVRLQELESGLEEADAERRAQSLLTIRDMLTVIKGLETKRDALAVPIAELSEKRIQLEPMCPDAARR